MKKHFKNQTIGKITHYQYQKFLNKLFEDDYAKNTILCVNNNANMIFKYALKNKWIQENPVTDVIIPKKS